MIRELLKTLRIKNSTIPNRWGQCSVSYLRGAHVSTTKFGPEVFFAVDCSPADIYGNQGKVGDGTLFVSSIQVTSCPIQFLTTAEEAGIK